MAYNLRQAFERAIDRINLIENITLDREYSIINSYKVIRETLDMDQQDAMLQLIEHCIGEVKLSDQEYDQLEKMVFGSPEEDQDGEEAINSDSWVFTYLSKKGKNLDTLEKAVMRMTKAEVLKKFADCGWGLTMEHSKIEMISIILTELQNLGYKQAA